MSRALAYADASIPDDVGGANRPCDYVDDDDDSGNTVSSDVAEQLDTAVHCSDAQCRLQPTTAEPCHRYSCSDPQASTANQSICTFSQWRI